MIPSSSEAAGREAPPPARRRRTFLQCFLHQRLGVAAAGFLVLLVVACVGAPLIAPYGADTENLTSVLASPSFHHLLGTDELGRDVLSRLLYGGVPSLEGILEALGVAIVLAVPLGLLAAYRGGWLDAVLSRVADLGLAIPVIVVLLMVFSLPVGGQEAALVALGILYAPSLFRVVRASALPLRDALYVVNARLSGVSRAKILWRHVLPGAAGPLAVNLSLTAGLTLVVESGLNYLGLGVKTPAPSWGGMISDAQTYLQQQPWLLIPTGVLLALTVLSLALLGDGIRDALAEMWALEPSPQATTRKEVPVPKGSESSLAGPLEDAVLSIRGCSVSIQTGAAPLPVVSDVSFDVMRGEAVGIVGESGCGKTLTMLSTIGLLPPAARQVAGRCWFQGEEVLLNRRRRSRLPIGYVAQDPMVSLDPCFTVGFSIGEVVRSHGGGGSKEVRKRTLELMESVQIPAPADVARRYPHQLSGGLAQRVQIAMALAVKPVLLVADEPTTALDVTIQAEILDLLRSLREQFGMALLLITHDWGVIADSCDRAVVMYAGEVIEQGAIAELHQHPLHPYTKALLQANPQNAAVGKRLVTIPGRVPAPGEWQTGCRFAPRCAHVRPECEERPVELIELCTRRETRCVLYDRIPVEVGR